MARKPSAKVVLARRQFDELTIGVADALADWAKSVITEAAGNAPDSPYDPYPLGEGLPKQGGVLAYVSGLKVFGWSLRGVQPKKPRAMRVPAKEHAIAVAGGFGFPARLAEAGSIRQPGQPFLAPVFNRRKHEIPEWVARFMRPILARP